MGRDCSFSFLLFIASWTLQYCFVDVNFLGGKNSSCHCYLLFFCVILGVEDCSLSKEDLRREVDETMAAIEMWFDPQDSKVGSRCLRFISNIVFVAHPHPTYPEHESEALFSQSSVLPTRGRVG